MIFVTVGTQLSFDRLISIIDKWSISCGHDVVAQVGGSKIIYSNITAFQNVSPDEFNGYFKRADLIVAHAGMGSVITALSLGKPIIIFPRRAALFEHRNDHQLATAKWLKTHPGITVAFDEDELLLILSNNLAKKPSAISDCADEEFINNLRNYIWSD